MYHNLNMVSHVTKGGKYTPRPSEIENDDFLALRKWIDQIPDNVESSMDLHNDSKFNHIYVSSMANPWHSDINEEVSLLVTERTSELTTEHCSDTKHWNSHQAW